MIFKSFEFKKINIKEYYFYLFYGENNGLKELIDTNFKTIFNETTYNYNENDILKDENKFFDEILSKSFLKMKN